MSTTEHEAGNSPNTKYVAVAYITPRRPMATRRAKPGRLAKGREIEIEHLVDTLGLSPSQAQELLTKYGNDWERIRQEAEKFNDEA